MSVERVDEVTSPLAPGTSRLLEPAALPGLAGSAEDSPEAFVNRWRRLAADAEIFARPEGVPLIECRVAGAVIQVFERTGPYLSRPGPNRLIVNPTVETLSLADHGAPHRFESLGLSRVAVTGTVLEVEGLAVAVDAGAPLIVTSRGPLPPGTVPGAIVSFESDAPVHGFVVVSDRPSHHRRETVDDSI
ncbi:MAG TPA: hypothetical protein VFF10_03105 [Trueperaceae bacterium]|nr:hypothetical protein [Trueperaceae bacterium]